MMVKNIANEKFRVQYPTEKHITTVGLTEINDKPEPSKAFSKNVVVFGEGQADRSPCGIGTCAVMAALYSRGVLPLGVEFTNESIIGTRFKGKLVKETRIGDFVGVDPIVTGSAYITGIQQFVVDPRDPVKHGFVLGLTSPSGSTH
jgi:proline racemase/trans-L-3-hydroxyproline dehydratase